MELIIKMLAIGVVLFPWSLVVAAVASVVIKRRIRSKIIARLAEIPLHPAPANVSLLKPIAYIPASDREPMLLDSAQIIRTLRVVKQ